MKTESWKHKRLASKLTSAVLSLALLGTGFVGMGGNVLPTTTVEAATTTDYGLADSSQEGVILHCWNWSYNNIKKYMKDIAAAGYTSVQTSPVQQPKDYYWDGVAYGNVGIPNGTGGEDGNWWKAYQPVTFSICDNGHTWYGTKEEFTAMCKEADKYGVKVIVDIVANHMGNIQGYKIGDQETVMGDISPQVGEFWNPDMLTDPSYWHISTSWTHTSDGRFDVTQGNMGMPDLNTGDSKVQQMVLGLLNECIDCGADGFRFDAAKHIETPADDSAFSSEFWNVVLDGAREHYKQVNGYDGVYFYGETLNRIDDTAVENYYLSKMSITDNSTSDNLRNSVVNGSVSALATSGYCGYAHGQGNKVVLWAESHDTYMGGGSSYDANDSDIKKTWAIIASRKNSTGLFFARPYYSKDILAGDVSKARQSIATIMENIDEQTQLGDVGSLTWADPAVVEANRFRNFFVGQSEKLGSSGNIAYNVRGKTGIVIVAEGPCSVSLSVGMTDGTYYDQVGGEAFTVSGGTIKGKITNADGIAVVYNPTVDYGDVNPVQPTKISISAATADGSSVFTTDTTDVTMTVNGASTATYTTSEGQTGTFTSSKTINVGAYTATGDAVSVTIKGTASDGITKEKTYNFTKKVISSEYPSLSSGGVVFDNSKYGWAKVYCYVYDESGSSVINNGAWPGEAMTEEQNDYWTYEFPSKFTGDVRVIFSNGSGVQYPSGSGLTMSSSDKSLFSGTTVSELPESVKTLSVSLDASASKVAPNQSVTLTATAANANGNVKYTFLVNDGTTLVSGSSSNSCTWTPTAKGTYIVAVRAADSSLSITATTTITVGESTGDELYNNSTISSTSINAGDSVTVTNKASGGKSPYTYAVYYKKSTASSYTTAQDFSTAATTKLTLTDAGTYSVLSKVKDSNNTVTQKEFTVVVSKVNELTNNSTISSEAISAGDSVTVTHKASGGTSPYTYALYYKKSTASSYTTAQSFSTTATTKLTLADAGTYTVVAKVKDSAGSTSRKEFTVVVSKVNELTNNSTISSEAINAGDSVTLTLKASGGTTPYTYAVYYKKSTDSSYTTAQTFSTTATKKLTFADAGTYYVVTKVKDSAGTVARKEFKVVVSKVTALTNNSTISSEAINAGGSVTVTHKASGGTSPYTYAVYYKKSTASSFTTAQTFSKTATTKLTFADAGTYTVVAKVKDSTGALARKEFKVVVSKVTALTNNSTISSESISAGGSVTVTHKASGGTSPYTYAVYYKKSTASSYTTAQTFSKTATTKLTLTDAGTYTVVVKVKDSTGALARKEFKVVVSKVTALTNNSTISSEAISAGGSVTVTHKASGGTSPYTYAVYYKKSTDSSYTTAQKFSTTATTKLTFADAGTYSVVAKVKDSAGALSRQEFTVEVSSAVFTNTSTISSTTLALGKSITVKCSATGGTKPYNYAVYYKKTSSSTYTIAQDYSTNTSVTIKPQAAATYNVLVNVRDNTGAVKSKSFKLTVTA